MQVFLCSSVKVLVGIQNLWFFTVWSKSTFVNSYLTSIFLRSLCWIHVYLFFVLALHFLFHHSGKANLAFHGNKSVQFLVSNDKDKLLYVTVHQHWKILCQSWTQKCESQTRARMVIFSSLKWWNCTLCFLYTSDFYHVIPVATSSYTNFLWWLIR